MVWQGMNYVIEPAQGSEYPLMTLSIISPSL